jgi:hypothetical protein
VADPNARPSTKVQVAKQLAVLRGAERAGVVGEALAHMQRIVKEYCPSATAGTSRPTPCATSTFGCGSLGWPRISPDSAVSAAADRYRG